jgi:hypothetical protein
VTNRNNFSKAKNFNTKRRRHKLKEMRRVSIWSAEHCSAWKSDGRFEPSDARRSDIFDANVAACRILEFQKICGVLPRRRYDN